MRGMAASKSQQEQIIYINTVTGNQIIGSMDIPEKERSRNITLPRGAIPLGIPPRSLKGTPDWPLRKHFSVRSLRWPQTETNVPFSKGQGEGLIQKSAIFQPLFFIFSSFKSNLKCMDEVNYFIVHLSLLIFILFFFYCLFYSRKINEEISFCPKIRLEPFSLATVASGTTFPGHW